MIKPAIEGVVVLTDPSVLMLLVVDVLLADTTAMTSVDEPTDTGEVILLGPIVVDSAVPGVPMLVFPSCEVEKIRTLEF